MSKYPEQTAYDFTESIQLPEKLLSGVSMRSLLQSNIDAHWSDSEGEEFTVDPFAQPIDNWYDNFALYGDDELVYEGSGQDGSVFRPIWSKYSRNKARGSIIYTNLSGTWMVMGVYEGVVIYPTATTRIDAYGLHGHIRTASSTEFLVHGSYYNYTGGVWVLADQRTLAATWASCSSYILKITSRLYKWVGGKWVLRSGISSHNIQSADIDEFTIGLYGDKVYTWDSDLQHGIGFSTNLIAEGNQYNAVVTMPSANIYTEINIQRNNPVGYYASQLSWDRPDVQKFFLKTSKSDQPDEYILRYFGDHIFKNAPKSSATSRSYVSYNDIYTWKVGVGYTVDSENHSVNDTKTIYSTTNVKMSSKLDLRLTNPKTYKTRLGSR